MAKKEDFSSAVCRGQDIFRQFNQTAQCSGWLVLSGKDVHVPIYRGRHAFDDLSAHEGTGFSLLLAGASVNVSSPVVYGPFVRDMVTHQVSLEV